MTNQLAKELVELWREHLDWLDARYRRDAELYAKTTSQNLKERYDWVSGGYTIIPPVYPEPSLTGFMAWLEASRTVAQDNGIRSAEGQW